MNLTNKRIVVAGEVCVDEYLHVEEAGKSPEHSDVTIQRVVKRVIKEGMSANVANNLKSVGALPLLITNYGNSGGIKKTRVVDTKGNHLLRIDQDKYDKKHSETDIYNYIVNACRNDLVEGLIIQDYGKRFWSKSLCQSVIESVNVPVFVDPYPTSELSWYKGCTAITPNIEEMNRLTGETSCVSGANKILDETGAEYCLITLGEHGMMYMDNKLRKAVYIRPEKVDVVDVCGAGDTVISILTYLYLHGLDFKTSAKAANKAASLVVQKDGVSTISKKQLLEIINDKPSN